MNEPAINHEFPVTVQDTVKSIEYEQSAMIAERYWKAGYMKRNSFQELRELDGSGGMRGDRQECLCARQSRSTRNGRYRNVTCPA